MKVDDLIAIAQETLAERGALAERFKPGGDLDFIEAPEHQANILGPAPVLAQLVHEMVIAEALYLVGKPVLRDFNANQCRALALAALRRAEELDNGTSS